MTTAFQNLNHEVIQLRAQIRGRQKASQFNIVADASQFNASVSDNSTFVIASQAQSISIVSACHSKKQKPRDQSSYHEESEDEHIRWFQNVRIEFLTCSNYFWNDRAKILWCMRFLKGDSQSQWFIRTNDDEDLKSISYDYFKSFLLNLVADSMNRRLIVYENWERIRQRSNQKVSNFKSELKEYEIHLSSFEKMHRVNFFFVSCCRLWKKSCWVSRRCQRLRRIYLRRSLCWRRSWSASDAQMTIHSTIQTSTIREKTRIRIKFSNNFNNNSKFNSIKTLSMTMNAIRVREASESVKRKKIYSRCNVMIVIKWTITKVVVLSS